MFKQFSVIKTEHLHCLDSHITLIVPLHGIKCLRLEDGLYKIRSPTPLPLEDLFIVQRNDLHRLQLLFTRKSRDKVPILIGFVVEILGATVNIPFILVYPDN